jgi:hypothetical protein
MHNVSLTFIFFFYLVLTRVMFWCCVSQASCAGYNRCTRDTQRHSEEIANLTGHQFDKMLSHWQNILSYICLYVKGKEPNSILYKMPRNWMEYRKSLDKVWKVFDWKVCQLILYNTRYYAGIGFNTGVTHWITFCKLLLTLSIQQLAQFRLA